jgi:hypothetical protein
MSPQAWERDVLNRQRNIVFPDTNLNQGRFYRNIASGKAVYTFGQRISLLGIVGFFIIVNAADFASTFGEFLAKNHFQPRWIVWPSLYSLLWLLFWIFLAVKGLLPAPPPARKRRGGYRRSSRA